jgi:hypothetical protein
MLLPRERAINEDTDSSDGEEEAATAACGYNAEPSHGTRRAAELAGRARGYDDVDTDSDMEEGGDEFAAGVIGTSPAPYYGWPRATTGGGGGVESQLWGFAGQSQTERQALALWEDFERRVLEDLLQQVASCPCALVAEDLFTVRRMEPALWIEEVRRREAAQQELDRALARDAAAAAETSDLALQGGRGH